MCHSSVSVIKKTGNIKLRNYWVRFGLPFSKRTWLLLVYSVKLHQLWHMFHPIYDITALQFYLTYLLRQRAGWLPMWSPALQTFSPGVSTSLPGLSASRLSLKISGGHRPRNRRSWFPDIPRQASRKQPRWITWGVIWIKYPTLLRL